MGVGHRRADLTARAICQRLGAGRTRRARERSVAVAQPGDKAGAKDKAQIAATPVNGRLAAGRARLTLAAVAILPGTAVVAATLIPIGLFANCTRDASLARSGSELAAEHGARSTLRRTRSNLRL